MTPEEISTLKREQYNAQVVYLRKKNPDLMILRVKTDFPRPIHKPGQYSTLGLGFWEPRHPGLLEDLEAGFEIGPVDAVAGDAVTDGLVHEIVTRKLT